MKKFILHHLSYLKTHLAVGTTKGFRIYDIENNYDIIAIKEGKEMFSLNV